MSGNLVFVFVCLFVQNRLIINYAQTVRGCSQIMSAAEGGHLSCIYIKDNLALGPSQR